MDVHDISPSGKRRFAKWLSKHTRKHHIISVSRVVASAPNEFKLFKMTRFIDKCYATHEEGLGASHVSSEVLIEDTGEDICEGLAPESDKTVIVENKDYPSMHKALRSQTQMKYDAFTNHTKGRISEIINKRTDIPISRIISEADSEADVIQFLDGIREVTVNPEVRKWTCREVV